MRPTETGEHVVVEAKSGAVRGFWRTHSAAFLGIPFAEPPYGDLRSRARSGQSHVVGFGTHFDTGPTPQRKALAEGDHDPGTQHSG